VSIGVLLDADLRDRRETPSRHVRRTGQVSQISSGTSSVGLPGARPSSSILVREDVRSSGPSRHAGSVVHGMPRVIAYRKSSGIDTSAESWGAQAVCRVPVKSTPTRWRSLISPDVRVRRGPKPRDLDDADLTCSLAVEASSPSNEQRVSDEALLYLARRAASVASAIKTRGHRVDIGPPPHRVDKKAATHGQPT
jgi:hypothetical protein